MTLSDSQQRAQNAIASGASVFVTGCGGTGKSYLMTSVSEVRPNCIVYNTATTGEASKNLDNGCTIHSFAGICPDDLKNSSIKDIVGKLRGYYKAAKSREQRNPGSIEATHI